MFNASHYYNFTGSFLLKQMKAFKKKQRNEWAIFNVQKHLVNLEYWSDWGAVYRSLYQTPAHCLSWIVSLGITIKSWYCARWFTIETCYTLWARTGAEHLLLSFAPYSPPPPLKHPNNIDIAVGKRLWWGRAVIFFIDSKPLTWITFKKIPVS